MNTAAELIKKFEGLRLEAYPDPATGGKPWTVGYGCTGPGIGPGTVWTQQEADDALDHRLTAVQQVILGLVRVSLSPCELAALSSFCWNVGTDAFAKSTMLKKLNAGDRHGAADEFLRWTKADGRQMLGLLNRRQAERAVFLKSAA